ncbi:hypothetical protein C7212DRAFT_346565 [Tuber magnatum]|uniref:Uncharacterized protein n=1 Tax=Tuber magnatum TaxID=42249 RepID=A0A317SLB2_9PEZI|nr:hypothetical protein C7212DRAFT_346565 [Tuber magnatum]
MVSKRYTIDHVQDVLVLGSNGILLEIVIAVLMLWRRFFGGCWKPFFQKPNTFKGMKGEKCLYLCSCGIRLMRGSEKLTGAHTPSTQVLQAQWSDLQYRGMNEGYSRHAKAPVLRGCFPGNSLARPNVLLCGWLGVPHFRRLSVNTLSTTDRMAGRDIPHLCTLHDQPVRILCTGTVYDMLEYKYRYR